MARHAPRAVRDGPRTRVRSISGGLLVGFSAVAVALVAWTVVRAPGVLRRDDNPRLIEEEIRVQRGSILDANENVLAESVSAADGMRRLYPEPSAGPVVGYYSLRHGTAGIEDSYNALVGGQLSGFWEDWLRHELLHVPRAGGDVRLTLRSDLQRAAHTLLGGRIGALVLVSVRDSSMQVLLSQPDYDPNSLDERFAELSENENAPLLNRATQGLYQPGLVLQPFLVAGALEQSLIRLQDDVADYSAAVDVHGVAQDCSAPQLPQPVTWKEVLIGRCPAPMVELGRMLGAPGLSGVLASLGFHSAPVMSLPTEVSRDLSIDEPGKAAIGQDNLTVSPMQVALALAALANGGWLRPGRLVEATRDVGGDWQAVAAASDAVQVLSSPTTAAVLEAMHDGQRLHEYSTIVLSGPELDQNAWYLGLAPAGEPRLAVVVVLEDTNSVRPAEQIGREVLSQALRQ